MDRKGACPMRHIVVMAALACVFPVGAQRLEAFSVPVLPTGRIPQGGEIAGVGVYIDWNGATSVPTVLGISPKDPATNPVVLSRTGSAAEVALSAAEFNAAHPE